MAWVALSFAYKEVLASTKMNQIQTNLDLCLRLDAGQRTITQSVVGEWGLVVERTGSGAETYPVVTLRSDNPTAAQAILVLDQANAGDGSIPFFILNSGTGNDFGAPGFNMKNGYIAPGGNEAMRWDVIVHELDGSGLENFGYNSLDEAKVMGFYIVGFDISGNDVTFDTSKTDNPLYYSAGRYRGGTGIQIAYGTIYVAGDFIHIIVLYVA